MYGSCREYRLILTTFLKEKPFKARRDKQTNKQIASKIKRVQPYPSREGGEGGRGTGKGGGVFVFLGPPALLLFHAVEWEPTKNKALAVIAEIWTKGATGNAW